MHAYFWVQRVLPRDLVSVAAVANRLRHLNRFHRLRGRLRRIHGVIVLLVVSLVASAVLNRHHHLDLEIEMKFS